MFEQMGQTNNLMAQYMRLMLDKGTWFLGRTLVKQYPSAKKFVSISRPKMKECFKNAQLFAISCEEGRYFEGYMCDGTIAVHHGCTVMPDNCVIDFTLEARDHKHKNFQSDNTAYLGVEVPASYLKKKIFELEVCQPYAQFFYLNKEVYFL
jgi:hypothetical protein